MTSPGDNPPAQPPGAAMLRRVEEVFFEVSALSPHDREQAIVRLCAGDPALEAEVRSLVRSAGQIGSFLEQPALGKEFDQLDTESRRHESDDMVGVQLGAFRIEGRLASGGMGTVYTAVRADGQFDQKVAIKIVKRGMDSEEILARFKAERQTLAGLDHPNIARLLDGGVTPDGRPFLVMEFVDGRPIDDYCDSKRLSVTDRLKLFRDVCAGVHAAHQSLVIHRDLKPSNILVTPQGVPKLLDFGIAKMLEGDGTAQHITAETDRRLTPEYASPEQVDGGPITTASDVYSLGVVLYELLTGSRPYYFGPRTSEEVRRIVCFTEPPAPSAALTVHVSRLRTASGRADPSPSRPVTPPPSPSALAPHPATDIPKTRGVSSTRLRSQLRGDLDNIVLMALRKEPHRRYASAEQLSADINLFLSGMPVHARKDTLPYRASKFVRRHAVSVTLSAAAVILLSGATVMLYGQRQQLSHQRDELVTTNKRLSENARYLEAILRGGEAGNQGPDARLGSVLAEAAAALKTSPPTDPMTRAAAELSLGRALMSVGLLDEARPLLDDAAVEFATLSREAAPRIDAQLALAELLVYEGKHAQAEQPLLTLLSDERARANGQPTEREGILLNDLGSAQRQQGKIAEAIASQGRAIAVREAVFGVRSLDAAESRNNLASALFQRGDYAGAITEFEQSLEVRQALLRPDHPLIIRVQANLGLAQLRAGHADLAVPLLKSAAASWDKAFGPDHPGRVATMTSLAQALRAQDRPDEALTWLNQALAWQQGHQPAGSAQIAATEANIGITLAEAKKDGEARAILERVLPRVRGAGPGMSTVTRHAVESLVSIYERAGEAEKAQQLRQGAQ